MNLNRKDENFMEIPFVDLRPMHDELRNELDAAYKKVMIVSDK